MEKKTKKRIFTYCSLGAALAIVSTVVISAYATRDVPVPKALTLKQVEAKDDSGTLSFYPLLEQFQGELLKGYINQSLSSVVENYTKNPAYENVALDYTVTRNDGNILSVLFKGTVDIKDLGITIPVMDSVNLDVAKSTNEIRYDNLIKDTDEARAEVQKALDEAARAKGIKNGLEADGIEIYFQGTDIVFYYMPPDDSARTFVELRVPVSQIQAYLNTDFGTRPAS